MLFYYSRDQELRRNFVSEMIGTFVLVLVASALLSKRIAPGDWPAAWGRC